MAFASVLFPGRCLASQPIHLGSEVGEGQRCKRGRLRPPPQASPGGGFAVASHDLEFWSGLVALVFLSGDFRGLASSGFSQFKYPFFESKKAILKKEHSAYL